MSLRVTRRQVVAMSLAAGLSLSTARARQSQEDGGWSLPIRNEGGVPGDGFYVRYGYGSENTLRHPGWLHTAEDWHRDGDLDTAGAEVVAVRAGEVVFAGFDYPGSVVIVRHEDELYSMYGHLDYAVDVDEGELVMAGQLIGRVLAATNWRSDNHLHFELRNFLVSPVVNGDSPQYGVNCGYQCPPGPGYWPVSAPEHPSELGWRNPTHVIYRGCAAMRPLPSAVVASGADGLTAQLRGAATMDAAVIGELLLVAGERYNVLAVEVGDPASLETSAFGYDVWYQVQLFSGAEGWTQAVIPVDTYTGQDGRPSSVRPVLLPIVD